MKLGLDTGLTNEQQCAVCFRNFTFLLRLFLAYVVILILLFLFTGSLRMGLTVTFAVIFGVPLFLLPIAFPLIFVPTRKKRQLFPISTRGGFLGAFGVTFGGMNPSLSGRRASVRPFIPLDKGNFGIHVGLSPDGIDFMDALDNERCFLFKDIISIDLSRDMIGRSLAVIRLNSGDRYWIRFRLASKYSFDELIKDVELLKQGEWVPDLKFDDYKMSLLSP